MRILFIFTVLVLLSFSVLAQDDIRKKGTKGTTTTVTTTENTNKTTNTTVVSNTPGKPRIEAVTINGVVTNALTSDPVSGAVLSIRQKFANGSVGTEAKATSNSDTTGAFEIEIQLDFAKNWVLQTVYKGKTSEIPITGSMKNLDIGLMLKD